MPASDELLAEAIALEEKPGGAGSIHIASALRPGPAALTIVTRDRQLAAAAENLGLTVLDPVTGGPDRDPVTAAPSPRDTEAGSPPAG